MLISYPVPFCGLQRRTSIRRWSKGTNELGTLIGFPARLRIRRGRLVKWIRSRRVPPACRHAIGL